MGIADRDYMYEDYETRTKEKQRRIEIQKRQDEMFCILRKKKLNVFDKLRLKKLERLNRKAFGDK